MITPIKRIIPDMIDLSEQGLNACRKLVDQIEQPYNPDYPLVFETDLPKWAVLCYLGDYYPFVFHGSPVRNLNVLRPQHNPSRDLIEFGCRDYVFASPDPLWAMWFAVMNSARKVGGTVNGCLRREVHGKTEKHYWFAIADDNFTEGSWLADGMLYICRKEQFPYHNGEEWGSTTAIIPEATLDVTPQDFPFRQAVLGYRNTLLHEYIRTKPDQLPWFEDEEIYSTVPAAYLTESVYS